jgi:glycosidase
MKGGDDPDNRRDFPGGFPGDSQNAFTQAGRTPEQQDVFAYVQSLLRLRQSHVALRGGRHQHVGWGENYYAFVRETETEKLLIVFNNATSAQKVTLPANDTSLENARNLTPVFGTATAVLNGGTLEVNLPAKTMGIYLVR